ncbi:MAG: hypothetical protein QW707_05585 [Candidatus Bathyarchaeia archaeon]
MRFSRFKNAVKRAFLALGGIAVALPAVAAQTLDMNAVTNGVVQLVMALLPVIIVIVIVKALIEAFARMT